MLRKLLTLFVYGIKTHKKTQVVVSLFVLILFVSIIYFGKNSIFKADENIPPGRTQTANLTTNWQDYQSSGSTETAPKLPKYEKFELTFDINRLDAPGGTVTNNLNTEIDAGNLNAYWPYDSTPAANVLLHSNAVPAGKGISVEGLFTNDNWQTTITQPGFYYQNYATDPADPSRTMGNGLSWLSPEGLPVWKVRFAPTGEGAWQYKIQIRDASGITQSGENSLTAVASTNKGFVKVSPTDSRYFETSDGSYLPMVGLSNDVGNTSGLQDEYPNMKNMGVNLVRAWWQASNPQLALFGSSGQGGDQSMGDLELSTDSVPEGRLAVAKITNKAFYATVPVKPGKKYRLSAKVKTVNSNGGSLYFNVYGTGDGDEHGVVNVPLTQTNDWQETHYDVTNVAGATQINWLGVGKTGGTTGEAYVSDWSFREILNDNGDLSGEILSRPNFNPQIDYPQTAAFAIDNELEVAKANNIYIKAVIEEKQDGFFNRIQANGTFGALDISDGNVNLYANPTHASRTYQTYYWRYLIARYGYSTALQSVEFVNEADPGNFEAVDALSQYFNANDPNRHMTTTSTWHTYSKPLWSNGNIDYADLHMYMGWGIASGGNRLLPGWDGSWSGPGPANADINNVGPGFEISNDAHSAPNSLKMTIPFNGSGTSPTNSNLAFQAGVNAGDELHISYYAKAEGLTVPSSYWLGPTLWMYYAETGGDNLGEAPSIVPRSGTYPWELVEQTFTVGLVVSPENNNKIHMITCIPRYWYNASSSSGQVWFDDLKIENLTTGQVINYNGGFDNLTSESYDVAAGHSAYSFLTHTFGLNKPTIRGEVGLSHPQRFDSQYKGFAAKGEDQLLTNDTAGLWWKKWTWANFDPGGLIEIYWWKDLLLNPNFGLKYAKYAKVYQNFMADIKLSNGKYQDIKATTSNTNIRALGQKEVDAATSQANKAFLWIDNAPYTWKAVVDHNFDITDSQYAWNKDKSFASTSIATYNSNIYLSKKDTRVFQNDVEYKVADYIVNNKNNNITLYRCNTAHNSAKNTLESEISYWDAVYSGYSLPPTGETYSSEWWTDRTSDWWTILDMKSYQPDLPLPASGTVTIPDFKNGSYKVDWWNTTTGQVFDSQPVEVTNNTITLGIHDAVGSGGVTSDVAVKIYPAFADPTFTLGADKTEASAGGIIKYTVNFKNNAPDGMKNVVVTSPIPNGTTYVENSADNNGNLVNNVIQWNVSTLATGANFSATYQVKLQ